MAMQKENVQKQGECEQRGEEEREGEMGTEEASVQDGICAETGREKDQRRRR